MVPTVVSNVCSSQVFTEDVYVEDERYNIFFRCHFMPIYYRCVPVYVYVAILNNCKNVFGVGAYIYATDFHKILIPLNLQLTRIN